MRIYILTSGLKVFVRNLRYKWQGYFAEFQMLNSLFACGQFCSCSPAVSPHLLERAKYNIMRSFPANESQPQANLSQTNHKQTVHLAFGVLHLAFGTLQNTPAEIQTVMIVVCTFLFSLITSNLLLKSLPLLFPVSITLQNSLLLSKSTSTRFRCMNAEILLSI